MTDLYTKRLIIRNLKHSDLDDFYFYRSNPEVTKYQGFDIMSKKESAKFIKSQTDKQFGIPGEWLQLGIEKKETGKLIGDCAILLEQNDPKTARIGLTISHTEQRKGYAKEILFCILYFLFEEIQVRRVVEIADVENIASVNLLKSTGFRFEGHFIENIFFKGNWGSEYQFAMLKREWDVLKTNILNQL